MQLQVDGDAVFAGTGGKPFDPALPAIVFVHGAGLDHTVWKLQTRYFAWHERAVLAVDLPGHGRSAGTPLTSLPAMADWLARLLDAAGLQKAALVGHSMGALVALDAAGRHPARIAKLALLGPGFPMRVNDVLLDAAKANDIAAIDMMNVWGYGRPAQLGRHRMPGLWMMRSALRLWQHAAPGVLYTDLAACNAYEGGLAAAEAVTCPTLAVLGDADLMAPMPLARAITDRIENIDVVTLPGAGHTMIEEQPDETLDALRRLL
jgi:pimeloyl-ACP methyl ester carboxylesterase